MRYAVKSIVVVLSICLLASFIGEGQPTTGLRIGEVAPDFSIPAGTSDGRKCLKELSDFRGKYVLISFWASYDAHSRIQNASLNNVLCTFPDKDVELLSISFDEYRSVFKETIRIDHILPSACFVELEGDDSDLFRRYQLHRGFSNYLLDEEGVIVDKNVSARELADFLENC